MQLVVLMSVSLIMPTMKTSIWSSICGEIVSDLEPTVAPCKIEFDAPKEIQIRGGSRYSCGAYHQ